MFPFVSTRKAVAVLNMWITFPNNADPPETLQKNSGADVMPDSLDQVAPRSVVFNTSPVSLVTIAILDPPVDIPNNKFDDEVLMLLVLTCLQVMLVTPSTQFAMKALSPTNTKLDSSNTATP
jgi:hypothetical protein